MNSCSTAVTLISLGFNNLDDWGLLLAKGAAPFSVLGLSPALVMIVGGIVGAQLFIAWTQSRQAAGQTPLLLAVVTRNDWSNVYLSANIQRALVDHPTIPPRLISKVDLDNVTFVSNDRLLEMMSRTTATPGQVEAALQINAESRLRALKLTFLLLTGLGLLAFVPAGRLPGHRPGDVAG
jgi:hypothetical protein